jgi:hypothetical protein
MEKEEEEPEEAEEEQRKGKKEEKKEEETEEKEKKEVEVVELEVEDETEEEKTHKNIDLVSESGDDEQDKKDDDPPRIQFDATWVYLHRKKLLTHIKMAGTVLEPDLKLREKLGFVCGKYTTLKSMDKILNDQGDMWFNDEVIDDYVDKMNETFCVTGMHIISSTCLYLHNQLTTMNLLYTPCYGRWACVYELVCV